MSYCRWSSLGFQCDVYCYEDVSGGYTTHIAGRRRKRAVTEYDVSNANAFAESVEKRNRELEDESNPLLPIGLQHDGETFNDPTLQEFLDRLLYLKGLGYIVPDFAIERIKSEMAEEAA